MTYLISFYLNINTFKKWVKKYCDRNKLNYADGAANSVRYFYISKSEIKKEEITDEMPF